MCRLSAREGLRQDGGVFERSPMRQTVVAVLAAVAAVVLVVGVVRSVVTGESPLWLIGDAVVLVASLMLIGAFRRSRG
ncbi:hypothetical protein GCM10022256_13140 [Frondihabitans peucedani]|uniref:Uncharacterized protein n=1 Tax=Frondihabitans peucedani TaxID=598626 RepID=A0ABP8E0G8_9MICO